MRERLRRSDRPDRIFEVALAAAGQAGLLGRRRVLDSTPLYDAVATMDTVTLIRSAIRGLLRVAGAELCRAAARPCWQAAMTTPAPPSRSSTGTTWPPGRRLVDSRARDGYALLAVTRGAQHLPERGRAGCPAAGHGAGPGPGDRPARRVPHRPQGRPGPGDLHRRSRRPGTGTRPTTAASTATRATSPSTRTARSSPRPRSPPATPATPNPPPT